jgi:isoquinoline 1-oxidoreductase beta subunit
MKTVEQALNSSRRHFVVGSSLFGAGLAIGFPLSTIAKEIAIPNTKNVTNTVGDEIGAWVVVKPDDSVIVRVVRSEMGQGTATGLAQLVADELDCDWKKVSYEYPTPGESLKRKRVWGEFSTGGSRGIRTSHEYVRKGGAAARLMLMQAAANQWNVPVSECTTNQGVITHTPSGRKISYGKVAEQASKLPVPTEIVLKDPKDWKIIGKPLDRLDTIDKVNGKQIYSIDMKFPGMLIATIKQCPVLGGKLKSFDAAKVANLKGIKQIVAVDDYAVAVVGDSFWHVKKAMEALPIEWDLGPSAKVQQKDIVARLNEGLSADQAFIGNKSGDIKQAMNASANKVTSEYFYPYLNHAAMEPMNATAKWTPEFCEVWAPTQDGEATLAAVIAASGLPSEKNDVYKVNLGGGFGRRGAFQDYSAQAVKIAKQFPGTHVKLIWTREEDMTHGHYHPIMACKMTASFDSANQLTGIHMRLSGQSILTVVRPKVVEQDGGRDAAVFQGVFEGDGEHSMCYSFPNMLVDHAMRNGHIRPGFWRGVNANQNAIFMECFMDELAEQAKMDPLAFRRKYLDKQPRALAVLEAAAKGIGWDTPAKPGIYRGLAQVRCYGSYVAAACEISVKDKKDVKIHRIVAATDPGYAVNPAQIERQVAGSFVYGLSAAFMQECTVKDGAIEQANFNQFGSMHIAQMPKVETIIIQGGGIWGGVGEPTITVAAPAVLNAIYRATGVRYRELPLKKHGVQLV